MATTSSERNHNRRRSIANRNARIHEASLAVVIAARAGDPALLGLIERLGQIIIEP